MLYLLPFDGKYMTSCPMAIVMFALSLTICEIFTKQEICQIWHWKWSKSRSIRMSPMPFIWKCSIPYRSIFQKLRHMGTYVYANLDTLWHTNTKTVASNDSRRNLQCIADLPKNVKMTVIDFDICHWTAPSPLPTFFNIKYFKC